MHSNQKYSINLKKRNYLYNCIHRTEWSKTKEENGVKQRKKKSIHPKLENNK